MAAVVVDTNIVSFQFKRDTRAQLYDPHLTGRQCVLSFMTLAELDRWALERNWGPARQARLDRHVRQFAIAFADRTLCRWWAETCDRARRSGFPISPSDAWIAATALGMTVPLVTHNPADYAGVKGLTVITEAGP
jgi:tRNA(fMet)-specific endonuclease VapC